MNLDLEYREIENNNVNHRSLLMHLKSTHQGRAFIHVNYYIASLGIIALICDFFLYCITKAYDTCAIIFQFIVIVLCIVAVIDIIYLLHFKWSVNLF